MSIHLITHREYRPDIDGLRAIAVVSVVGYHAFPKIIPGGFIGVDIFFVISGYLMANIIFDSLYRGKFSFKDFYVRRINRIFPALLIVLLSCLAMGWFFLFSAEFKSLGEYIFSGAFFISNFLSWSQVGYFDDAAETKPLLHLWSLGIEEQFYLFWPLLCYFLWRYKFNLLIVVIVFAFVSFFLNVYYVGQDAAGVFFCSLTRFWELLSGSILALAILQVKYMPRYSYNIFISFLRI